MFIVLTFKYANNKIKMILTKESNEPWSNYAEHDFETKHLQRVWEWNLIFLFRWCSLLKLFLLYRKSQYRWDFSDDLNVI